MLNGSRRLREQRIELVELRIGAVFVRKPSTTGHLTDNRIKRAVGVLRRAEIPQSCMRFTSKAFRKSGREPRFADASFPGKEHHLAFAVLCSRPAPQQQFG